MTHLRYESMCGGSFLDSDRMNSDMQFGLVHISAGDLLRAKIAAGTDSGKRAKEYMEKGKLVLDEIVGLVYN